MDQREKDPVQSKRENMISHGLHLLFTVHKFCEVRFDSYLDDSKVLSIKFSKHFMHCIRVVLWLKAYDASDKFQSFTKVESHQGNGVDPITSNISNRSIAIDINIIR